MSGRNSSLWKNQQKRSVLGLSLHCISWAPSYLLTLVDNIYILLFTLNEWNLLSFSRQGALLYVFKKKRKRKPFLLFKIDTAKKPNNIFTSNWNLSLNEKEIARLQSQSPVKLSKKNFGRLLREINETCRKTRMSMDCRLNWVSN